MFLLSRRCCEAAVLSRGFHFSLSAPEPGITTCASPVLLLPGGLGGGSEPCAAPAEREPPGGWGVTALTEDTAAALTLGRCGRARPRLWDELALVTRREVFWQGAAGVTPGCRRGVQPGIPPMGARGSRVLLSAGSHTSPGQRVGCWFSAIYVAPERGRSCSSPHPRRPDGSQQRYPRPHRSLFPSGSLIPRDTQETPVPSPHWGGDCHAL